MLERQIESDREEIESEVRERERERGKERETSIIWLALLRETLSANCVVGIVLIYASRRIQRHMYSCREREREEERERASDRRERRTIGI